jgi:hypothetical protein
LLKIKIKRVERALRVAKARELVTALEESLLATMKFVRDQGRHQIDRRHLLRLRLP